jgi:O-antigen/teichoic acid export membrane protein
MLSAALVSAHFRVTLIATSRQGLELLSTAVGAAITLTLVIMFYGRFGLTSVAVAMVIGEISTLVLSFIFVHHYVVSVRLVRCIWPPAITTTITAALLLVWPSIAVWAKALIEVVFFALAIAVLDPDFLEIFRRITPATTQHAEQ